MIFQEDDSYIEARSKDRITNVTKEHTDRVYQAKYV